MIRVALADDQALVRAGFAALLDAEELLRAVRVAAGGEALLSPGVTRRLVAEFAARSRNITIAGLDRLTAREREVVELVASGLSNEEIANRLYLSPSTAKTHTTRAMTKLGARDRAQLVVFAYEGDSSAPDGRAEHAPTSSRKSEEAQQRCSPRDCAWSAPW